MVGKYFYVILASMKELRINSRIRHFPSDTTTYLHNFSKLNFTFTNMLYNENVVINQVGYHIISATSPTYEFLDFVKSRWIYSIYGLYCGPGTSLPCRSGFDQHPTNTKGTPR